MVYYTDKDVKGSGTGGQFNPQSPKAIEAMLYIFKQRPGRVIKRNTVLGTNGVPVSHHVADGALNLAEQMNLVTGDRTRTGIGWP